MDVSTPALHSSESHNEIMLYRKTMKQEWQAKNPAGTNADFKAYVKTLEAAGTKEVCGRVLHLILSLTLP